jgi:hypothetical protein
MAILIYQSEVTIIGLSRQSPSYIRVGVRPMERGQIWQMEKQGEQGAINATKDLLEKQILQEAVSSLKK